MAHQFHCENCGCNLTTFDKFAEVIINAEIKARAEFQRGLDEAKQYAEDKLQAEKAEEAGRNKAIVALREMRQKTKWPNTVQFIQDNMDLFGPSSV